LNSEALWLTLQRAGYPALHTAQPAAPFDLLYLAAVAFAHHDLARAAALVARAATHQPDSLLYAAAAHYLARVAREGKQQVYDAPQAFAAFVRGGGNIALYDAVSGALHTRYSAYTQLRLLDIGVGDGRALLPALHPAINALTLVEPSVAMLAPTQAALDARNIAYQAHAEPLQRFVQHAQGPWDIAQATFSLQSIPPAERPPLLRWLQAHCRRLLLVEFDPLVADDALDPAYVRAVAARFEQGLAEYDAERELVAQGFLMPVLWGFFDPTTQRTNYEQPIGAWRKQLIDVGFDTVELQLLDHYWWADAYLLDAKSFPQLSTS
jgi:hypothetical protein